MIEDVKRRGAQLDCAIAAGINMKARSVDALTLDSMTNFVAKRPVYSVLSIEKITTLAGMPPRSWEDAVKDYVTNYFAKTTTASR